MIETADRPGFAPLGGFKLRLVLYFVLLSLVPLAGVTWAFSVAEARNEQQRTDESLAKSVRAGLGQVSLELAQAARLAEDLARSDDVQQALNAGDRALLAEIAGRGDTVMFVIDGEIIGDPLPPLGASRSTNVVDGTRTIGEIRVSVPFDESLLQRLRERSGLKQDETLLLFDGGSTIAGTDALDDQQIDGIPLDPGDVDIGSTTYRVVAGSLEPDSGSASLLAVTPRSALDSALGDVYLRLILAALGSIAVVAAVAFLPGRAIAGSLRQLGGAASAIAQGRLSERVPVRGRDEFAQLARAFNDMASQLESRQRELREERERVGRALARLGEALSARNEPGALMAVVAESAIEATGAVGALVVQSGRQVVRVGDPENGTDPTAVTIGSGEDGETDVLLLYPAPGTRFGDEALSAAHSLATQAAIALENARLQRVLAMQAVTDDLTGLANRRRFEDALDHEVSRVERFGGQLALIIADIDDFKAVNDQHGHQVGDSVLRTFADVIRRTVRTVDIPARPGGEEFAVILPGTDLDEACLVAERLRLGLSDHEIGPAGSAQRVTASFGVTVYGEDFTAMRLFSAADEALYEAKALGKNRVVARQT
jgi:diguanylate cyclase (GGDEF)-like protein